MPTLDLATARQVADATTAKATELGIAVSVVVLDANGHTKLVHRMDGAGWFTPRIASGKAFTATAFRRDSADMAERFAGDALFAGGFAALSDGQMIIGPGAVVLRSGQEVAGAVAVSGGRPEQDVVCAQAGRACWDAR